MNGIIIQENGVFYKKTQVEQAEILQIINEASNDVAYELQEIVKYENAIRDYKNQIATKLSAKGITADFLENIRQMCPNEVARLTT